MSTLPWDWIIKITTAVLCGSIIGIERELKRKAAGMRTNVMICLGSTLYILAAEMAQQGGNPSSSDLSHIAGQVVVGLGFIGGGAIIQSRGRIQGLTTAATMWVVAAVGVLIGLGFPLTGFLVSVMVVGLLIGVGRLEYLMMGKCKIGKAKISFRDQPDTWDHLRSIFQTYDKKVEESSVGHHTAASGEPICFMEVPYCHVHPDHAEFLLDILKIPDVRQTTYSFLK